MFNTKLRANKTHVPGQQSRRQVQRRFPPGTLFLFGVHVGTIIGWAPVAEKRLKQQEDSGDYVIPSSWEALVLHADVRLNRVSWTQLRDAVTLEEWEVEQ